jgi:hypothetical protein
MWQPLIAHPLESLDPELLQNEKNLLDPKKTGTSGTSARPIVEEWILSQWCLSLNGVYSIITIHIIFFHISTSYEPNSRYDPL